MKNLKETYIQNQSKKQQVLLTVSLIVLAIFVFISFISEFSLSALLIIIGEIPLFVYFAVSQKAVKKREAELDFESNNLKNKQSEFNDSVSQFEDRRKELGINTYEDAERKSKELLSYANAQLKDINPVIANELEEAQKKAERIKTEAQITADEIINKANAEIDDVNKKRLIIVSAINSLTAQKKDLESRVINLTEEAMLQEFGLYEPQYDFADSSSYKDRLADIRDRQKALIKNGGAVTGNMNWTVNNNAAQGKKMVKDMQKLLLRAFNSDCDELINNVKFNTFDTSVKRMEKSFEIISKCGTVMSVAITKNYYNLKYEELCLALEYRLKKQEEKEEQKEIRTRMREEAKLQKEIEEARKKIQKEQTHYSNALEKINEQISNASESEISSLLDKKKIIEDQLSEIDKSIKDIDYREANAKAGYVYIISNIGAFGENIYKIGMTRRLDPMERVDELGDASVPFDFDVHAMIFSDNAPALEAALHNAFDDKKVNMVNKRREFFNVTLDEIENVVKKNYDKTVDFVRIPQAEQYRESLKMKANIPA